MPRLRATLDSNVLISAFLFRGVPRQVLNGAVLQLFQSFTAESILAEVERKLRYRFAKNDLEVAHALDLLRSFGILVGPQERVTVCRDPKDNHVLECALAGLADVIVTGDKDLLVLREFRGIRILSPRQFHDEFLPSFSSQPLP